MRNKILYVGLMIGAIILSGCDRKLSEFYVHDDEMRTVIDESINIDVLANDSYSKSSNEHYIVLHIGRITTPPPHGTAVIEANETITYTPDGSYFGADVFSYEMYVSGRKEVYSGGLTDFNRTGNEGEVTVHIDEVRNTKPEAKALSAELNCSVAGAPSVDIQLFGSDVDDDTLSYSLYHSPLFGNVTIAGSIATYTENGYHKVCEEERPDTFSYKVYDGKEYSEEANVTIHPMY